MIIAFKTLDGFTILENVNYINYYNYHSPPPIIIKRLIANQSSVAASIKNFSQKISPTHERVYERTGEIEQGKYIVYREVMPAIDT